MITQKYTKTGKTHLGRNVRMLYGGFKCTYDFQPEIKRGKLFFVSMGSGQPLADPFLAFVKRVLWKDQTVPRPGFKTLG
jgi:hypothetical protein